MTLAKKWCYHQISNIPNLTDIQQELYEYMLSVKPSTDTWTGTVVFLQKAKIYKQTPLFNEYLKSLGVFDRWYYSLLIYTNQGKTLPIHVDRPPWQNEHGRYGLNIPVYNCENTYTVWYEDCDIDYNDEETGNAIVDMSRHVSDAYYKEGYRTARFIKKDSSYREIDRLDSSKPAWVDYTIPHQPITNHNMPRALFTTRFVPDVSDIINKL